MKFRCDTAALREAVSVVGRVVSPHTSIPALEGILMRTCVGGVDLFGYDLDLGISTQLSAAVEEYGEIVLPAKVLQEIARRLPGDSAVITVDDKCLAEIVSGAAQYKIVGMGSEEFPEFPSFDDAASFTVGQETLASMIGQTLFAISTNDTKPVHTGSLFELDGESLRVISVDGYRLAMRREAVRVEEPMRFVVPGKALSEVARILNAAGEDPCEVIVAKKHVFFKCGPYEIFSRLLEGDFLDYNSAIPKEGRIRVRVSTRALTESVDRVSLLISDRLRSPLRVKFEKDEIAMSCSTALGRASDAVPAQNEGERIEMGFNNRYLLDALKNVDCDELILEISGQLAPMKLLPPEGDAFLFLVLPVRLRTEE